jgi:hypothetical protein
MINKERLKHLCRFKNLSDSSKGQSLVEMAIISPILIFMMIGLFEVGWGLRGYVILSNVNREITRFSVRPGYMDFSTKADVITSYNRIQDWVLTANSGELDLNFASDATGNASLIVSHVVVDTGMPFDISDPNFNNPATEWNCNTLDPSKPGYNPNNIFTDDDLIIHPGNPAFAYQAIRYPISPTRSVPASRLNYSTLISQTLIPQNNKFNCEVIKKGGVASANNLMITELFFSQDQLFGFPLIANPFTDPVPMYAHTIMRLSTGARSNGGTQGSIVDNINTIGPVCVAMPIILKQSQLGGNPQPEVTQLDILDGPGGGDWGWLSWNPAEDDENYLERELEYPQMSLNDYTNVDPATNGTDHYLNVGDYVRTNNGLSGSTGGVEAAAKALEGQIIIIPVWNDPGGFVTLPNPYPPPNTVQAYKIHKFIKVRVNSGGVQLTPNKKIMATYIGPADDACQ